MPLLYGQARRRAKPQRGCPKGGGGILLDTLDTVDPLTTAADVVDVRFTRGTRNSIPQYRQFTNVPRTSSDIVRILRHRRLGQIRCTDMTIGLSSSAASRISVL